MAKNPNFPPIKCPKCKRQKDLIVEQPSHGIKKHITFDCYCIKCNVNFNCHANVIDLSYSDVETAENGYPYSA